MTIERSIVITDQSLPWLRSFVSEAIGALRFSAALPIPVYTRVGLLDKIEGIPFQLSFNGHLLILQTPMKEATPQALEEVLQYCILSGRGGQKYRWDRLVLVADSSHLPDYLQTHYQAEPSIVSATHSIDVVEAMSISAKMAGTSQLTDVLESALGPSLQTLSNIYAFSYRTEEGLASQLRYLRVLLGSSLAATAYNTAAQSEFMMLRDFMKKRGLKWADVLEPDVSSTFGSLFFTTGQEGKARTVHEEEQDDDEPTTPSEDFEDQNSNDELLDDLIKSPASPKARVLELVSAGRIESAIKEVAVAGYNSGSSESLSKCVSLIAALIHKESGGSPTAVSSTGYCGLGQVGRAAFQTFREANPKYMSSHPGLSFAAMKSNEHVSEQLAVTAYTYTRALRRARDLLTSGKVRGDSTLFSRDHVVLASLVYGAGGGNTNKLIDSAETRGYEPTLSALYAHNPNWMKPYVKPFYHGMFVFVNSALYRA
jgi:hypothetical protein